MKKEEKFLNDCLEFDKKASIGTELLGVLTNATKYTTKRADNFCKLIHIEYTNNFLTIEANDSHQAVQFCVEPEIKSKESFDFFVDPEEIRNYKQGKIDYISTIDANNKKYPNLKSYYPQNDVIVNFKAYNVLTFLKSIKKVNSQMISNSDRAKQVDLYIKPGFDTDNGFLTLKNIYSHLEITLPVKVLADKDFKTTCNINYLINAIENSSKYYYTALKFEYANDGLSNFIVDGIYKDTFATKTVVICPDRFAH